jgi:hypothetical protein
MCRGEKVEADDDDDEMIELAFGGLGRLIRDTE